MATENQDVRFQPLQHYENSLGQVESHFAARPYLARKLNRAEFGFYLAQAWREAKAATMTPVENRANRLAVEIDHLKYQSSRVNIEPRRRRLQNELAGLAA